MIAVQRIRTNNDVNGNPRRLWLVYKLQYTNSISTGAYQRNTEVTITAYDEGYSGRRVLLDHGWEAYNAVELPDVEVSATEYKRLLKAHKPA